jgi:hypothetical protein
MPPPEPDSWNNLGFAIDEAPAKASRIAAEAQRIFDGDDDVVASGVEAEEVSPSELRELDRSKKWRDITRVRLEKALQRERSQADLARLAQTERWTQEAVKRAESELDGSSPTSRGAKEANATPQSGARRIPVVVLRGPRPGAPGAPGGAAAVAAEDALDGIELLSGDERAKLVELAARHAGWARRAHGVGQEDFFDRVPAPLGGV